MIECAVRCSMVMGGLGTKHLVHCIVLASILQAKHQKDDGKDRNHDWEQQ